MFSGIIETIGKILTCEMRQGCMYLSIIPQVKFTDLIIGESIAVNGVCLTVTGFSNHPLSSNTQTELEESHFFHVTVVPESLRCTNLKYLQTGDSVNLERSLQINSRLGGHFVQGHVDTVGQILELKQDESDAQLAKISIPKDLAKFIIPKGFITLDGMSITIIETTPEWFTVTFIPHTQTSTITQHYKLNDFINIEIDMLGKYVSAILGGYHHANSNPTR